VSTAEAGLLIYFDEAHRTDLTREKIGGAYERFSDALSLTECQMGQLGLALLGFSAFL